MEFSKYTNKNIEEIFKDLKTSERGLSENEAKTRLEIHGFNEVKAKEVGLLDIFLRQFKSPFFYLLFIASLIAFLIGEKIDGLLILIFVFINVFFGFFQEFRAERATFLLKKYLPQNVKVLRSGIEKTIDKKLLVAGDIVLLEAGDIVPADLRLLDVKNFLIDESVLTGESAPVSKFSQAISGEQKEIFQAKNIAFSGTSVISGEAEGIVIGTGKNTVLGEITKLVSGITREGAYEKNLLKFSRLILRIVVTTIIFVFLANLIIKGPTNLFNFLIFCIALIVSIIPEALPLIITFTLSEGALKLAKEKVIVKRLAAVENLGDIEILCTDKTGTLTENKLKLENVYSANKEKCLLYSCLASPHNNLENHSAQSSFDRAIWEGVLEKNRHFLEKSNLISEIPFDSFRLRNSVLIKDISTAKKLLIIKGAPEIILKLSSILEGDLNKAEIIKEIEKEGREGKRVLSVAFKEFNTEDYSENDEKDLTFLGYLTFKDPLKESAKESLHLASKLGLKIKILTGDSKEVAGAIAKEIGLIGDPEKVVIGELLDSLPEAKFKIACEEFSVFARVSPQTKLNIIQALQKKYEVGFIGEGINDTPALKASNVGIVVREAADISREVADVVLLEKDLRVIVNGIKNGRGIFSNINKYIKCVLASNFGNFYSIAVISLFIPFLPMLPVQILFGNILSDFPLIAIATDHIDVEELRKPKLYQLNRLLSLVILLALVSIIFDFIFFGIFYKFQPAFIQTLWFIESILTEIFLIFSIRTRHFFLKTKRPSVPLLVFTLLDAFIIILLPFTSFGQSFFHFARPPVSMVFIVLSLVLSYFIVSEIVKLVYFQHWQKTPKAQKIRNNKLF